MQVVWSREALDGLVGIEEHIAGDNPERAVTFVDEMIDTTESILSANPRAGRVVPEISRPEIREIIFGRYRIVYRIHDDRVSVLTVFPCQRELRRHAVD